jgi:hypothetical protein
VACLGRREGEQSSNGAVWTIASSPNRGTEQANALTAVACTSASACIAVGSWTAESVRQTLIESWNGSRWTIASSRNQGTNGNTLSGVSCTSASACTAVGWYNNPADTSETLVESWNGTAWTVPSSPDQGTYNNSLSAVSCTSAGACTAVGSYNTAAAPLPLSKRIPDEGAHPDVPRPPDP